MLDWSSLVPADQGAARMADSNYFSLAESMSAFEDPFEEYCEILGGGDLIRKNHNNQRSAFGMGSLLLASRSPPLEWDSDDLLDCDTLELLNSIDTMAPCINASKLYPS
ncbi:hypothetical protein D917_04444 [Trichinella nativa]|uniref:Uncharacterized protein n=1 Tax=Trichinella nativa TaxID=6335 RepID=A0A1Y3E9Y2_9BILA|nr:hypothetical protein D917_04444 [Trichinella nativa]